MPEVAPKTVTVTHRRFPQTFNKRQQQSSNNRRAQALERFANVIIRAVRANYTASIFTRDDVLTMVSRMRLSSEDAWAADTAGINDTSTGTRYHKVCAAVQYLLQSKQLVEIDWLRICLSERYGQLSQAVPPHVAYLPTIRKLVQEFPRGSKLDAMAVVDHWRSDQHMPENMKRMAVRGVLPALVREGLLQRGEFRNEFRVKN